MQRWLWNVQALQNWESKKESANPVANDPKSPPQQLLSGPDWWMPLKERHATGRASTDDPPRPVHLFGVEAHNFERFQMFIGQGR